MSTLSLLQQREVKLVAQLEKLRADIESAKAVQSIAIGSDVVFVYGRGERARELTGQVVAVDGTTIALLSGVGIDSQVYKVHRNAIKSAPAAEPAVEADPLAAAIPAAIPSGLDALENV